MTKSNKSALNQKTKSHNQKQPSATNSYGKEMERTWKGNRKEMERNLLSIAFLFPSFPFPFHFLSISFFPLPFHFLFTSFPFSFYFLFISFPFPFHSPCLLVVFAISLPSLFGIFLRRLGPRQDQESKQQKMCLGFFSGENMLQLRTPKQSQDPELRTKKQEHIFAIIEGAIHKGGVTLTMQHCCFSHLVLEKVL